MPESITLGSEEARTSWGQVIDTALAGTKVIITRWNRPSLILVSKDTWASLQEKAALYEALVEGQRALERDEWVPGEVLRERMAARGVTVDD